jgi:DNA invertase Pin-like site-specific DNA recombinase
MLHVLGAAAEFERSLIRERTLAGQQRYRSDYAAGKVGRTISSRSGKNLPPPGQGRSSTALACPALALRVSGFARSPSG